MVEMIIKALLQYSYKVTFWEITIVYKFEGSQEDSTILATQKCLQQIL